MVNPILKNFIGSLFSFSYEDGVRIFFTAIEGLTLLAFSLKWRTLPLINFIEPLKSVCVLKSYILCTFMPWAIVFLVA